MIDYVLYLAVIGTFCIWLLILFGLVNCKKIIKENLIDFPFLASPLLIINGSYFLVIIILLLVLGNLNHNTTLSILGFIGILYAGLLNILLPILKHITKVENRTQTLMKKRELER